MAVGGFAGSGEFRKFQDHGWYSRLGGLCRVLLPGPRNLLARPKFFIYLTSIPVYHYVGAIYASYFFSQVDFVGSDSCVF